VAEHPDGSLRFHKLPSTPDDPGRAVAAGVRTLAADASVEVVVHGSTVATNAFLEGRLGAVGLLVNRGFEDVIAIGRQRRRELYSLAPQGARRLVPERLVRGLSARAAADGHSVSPLDLDELDRAADELLAAGARTLVIAFLHAARHPEMERVARERLAARGIPVAASHEVSSEPREYERWATAVVDAGLAPVVGAYLGGLERRLGAGELRVMLSSGGTARAAEAAARPVSTILSGPAAGVVGAALVARAAGFERLITFDMGGTSCDVALVPGEPVRTAETELDGVPLRMPLIDIQTVGAGGGSIAWIDRAGGLRVGPRSAGAVPGPASYGAGGEEPTLTDAHVVLGHLDPARFLGGARPLDPALAAEAIARLARSAGAAPLATAAAVVAVSRGHLERAVRSVTLARGHDPADFTLVAFGGAGGLHAAGLAAALGCRSVMIPRSAGVLSALGCLAADVRRDFSRAVLEPAGNNVDLLERWFAPLAAEADRALAAEGIPIARRRALRSLAMRYRGQSYELDVPADGGGDPAADFHAMHEQRHGYARAEAAVEIVAARVSAVGLGRPPALPLHESVGAGAPVRRAVHFAGEEVEAECWTWARLPARHAGQGPAVIADDHATALVPPGWDWRVDERGNLILEAGS
jgi:N-methylhydantoinase A/oxoprolinase/acetone carboxylase beta subunit